MMVPGRVVPVLTLLVWLPMSGSQPAAPPNQVCILVPPDMDNCYNSARNKPISDRAVQVDCLKKLLWNFGPPKNVTLEERDMFRIIAGGKPSLGVDSLSGQLGNITETSSAFPVFPPSGFRVRKEYRTLTPAERTRFHNALNTLFQNGTIDMFARMHAEATAPHHNGASFLPWHRVFLAYFEEALRRVDPAVSLPYWDSTMDFDMDNPVNSVLWSPQYLGNGAGDVTTGPFAGWVTNLGSLQRNYGNGDSRLISKPDIINVLSRCTLQDISRPSAQSRYSLERYHDGVHAWLGGDMGFPSSAAYDPVFYMHHAFIDYVWELFRRHQYRDCHLFPSRDYPNITGQFHGPADRMIGFDWLTNIDGAADYWTRNWYRYESTPACPGCCRQCRRPAPVYCNRRRRVCIARSRRTFPLLARIDPESADVVSQLLDPTELSAFNKEFVGRNRGPPFHGPRNDGRTLATAVADAMAAQRSESRS